MKRPEALEGDARTVCKVLAHPCDPSQAVMNTEGGPWCAVLFGTRPTRPLGLDPGPRRRCLATLAAAFFPGALPLPREATKPPPMVLRWRFGPAGAASRPSPVPGLRVAIEVAIGAAPDQKDEHHGPHRLIFRHQQRFHRFNS